MTEVAHFTEDDYSELNRFIARTPRGRAFLKEHERRSQKLAAEEVIRLINELRESWHQHNQSVDASTQVEVLRRELLDMSASIVHARREISSLRPKDAGPGDGSDRIVTATNELDAIVQSTERASFDILNAAERILDRCGKLRAADAPADLCTDIDNEITNIFTACSFQDITGQRTTKVVNALRYIEQRVGAMISIWGVDSSKPEVDDDDADTRPDAHLLNGPSDSGIDQGEIDRLLNGEAPSEPSPAPASPPPPAKPKAAKAAKAPPAPPPEMAPAISQNDIDSMFP
ncbi:MAG: hypothetical protein WCF85_16515 [Rhodospirillaceae bacterium]